MHIYALCIAYKCEWEGGIHFRTGWKACTALQSSLDIYNSGLSTYSEH